MIQLLKGKKTYLVAGLIAILTVGLVAFHRLTPETALTLILLGGSALGATFRSALAEHQDEVKRILIASAAVGAAVASHQVPAALAEGQEAVSDTAKLVREIQDETTQQGAGQ